MSRAITDVDIKTLLPDASIPFFEVDGLDLVDGAVYERFITYLDDAKFIPNAIANSRAQIILTRNELRDSFPTGEQHRLRFVDDPRWTYFSLQNLLASEKKLRPTEIHSTAQIHPTAVIADYGVTICAGVVVEPGVVVHTSVQIGEDAIVRANAVLGGPGFEHKRTSRGILSVLHDGDTIIGARTEIGTSCTIAQGLARRNTILGEDCKLDGHVYVAHGTQIGNRGFFAAGAIISGMCAIGDDVWVGPGATIRNAISIGNGARIAIGSVALRNVPADTTVLGNPAKRFPS